MEWYYVDNDQRMGPVDEAQLQALETTIGFRYKAHESQSQAGIVRAEGEGDLIPGRIGLAPVARGPMRIERAQRAVLRLQIVLEKLPTMFTVADAIVFVVQLPADDVGIVSETRGHGANNPSGRFMKGLGIDAVVAAIAML